MTQNLQINCGIFPTIYVHILGLGLGSVALALHVSGLGLLALALTPLALLTSLVQSMGSRTLTGSLFQSFVQHS